MDGHGYAAALSVRETAGALPLAPDSPTYPSSTRAPVANQYDQANSCRADRTDDDGGMETSRSQVDRCVDPDSMDLETLARVVRAVGRQIPVELVEGR
jgi:hypothetical protein